MSAPELYTAALAAIAARRELLAAGTPGPWRVHENSQAEYVGFDDDAGFFRMFKVLAWATPGDAALLVAMHAAFAADTDALEAVLLRHHISPGTEHCDLCWDGPRRGIQSRDSWWPCPDAQAALTALGVPHE